MPPETNIAWLDELVEQVRQLHDIALRSGGSAGEHTSKLMSSCARPFQSAFGEPIYPDNVQRAAALFHGIITSHAFVDANKRTATLAAILFLRAEGVVVDVSDLQLRILGEIAVETAKGDLDVDDLAAWFRRILLP